MNYYFIALVLLYSMSLGMNIARHGEKRDDEYNALTSLISMIIVVGLCYLAIKTGF